MKMTKDREARRIRRMAEGLHRYLDDAWKGYWGWQCPEPGCAASKRKYGWTSDQARTSLRTHQERDHA
jgi:hypothetical protein